MGGLAKVLFRCRSFFFNCSCPFGIIYDSDHLENWLECVSPNNTQHLLSVNVTFLLREKSFSQFSEENYLEKTAFLLDFFCQIRISSLSALVVNFWNLAALRRHLPNNGLKLR